MKYPILIVKNNFKKKLDWKRGLQWFKDHTPLEIEITEMKTSVPITFEPVANATYQGVAVDENVKVELRKLIPENTYKCVVFLYGDDAPGIRTSTADHIPLYQGTDFVEVVKYDDGGKTFNHELIHTFFQRLKRQGIFVEDPMDMVNYNGQWIPYFNNGDLRAKVSNRTIALERLSPYWNQIVSGTIPVMATYKYFRDSEIVGLKPELVQKLDKARDMAGVPFVITSGLRSDDQNANAGGVSNSAHLRGLAADIKCTDSSKRWQIVNALIYTGFKRIGIGKDFIHADVDPSLPSPVMWTYYD